MEHFVNDTIPSPPPVETIPPENIHDTLIPELSCLDNRVQEIDTVYDELDLLLLANRFEDAQRIINVVTQTKLPLAILLSALTISYPWRVELGVARIELAKKAEKIAREVGGEAKVLEIARFLEAEVDSISMNRPSYKLAFDEFDSNLPPSPEERELIHNSLRLDMPIDASLGSAEDDVRGEQWLKNRC